MVGGELRRAVIGAMKPGGKVLTLGSMHKINGGGGETSGGDEAEAALLAEKSVTAHGGNVNNYEDEWLSCTAELVEMYKQGKLVSKDTVVEGLQQLPDAFCGIFKGANTGRMVVKVM